MSVFHRDAIAAMQKHHAFKHEGTQNIQQRQRLWDQQDAA